jgi:diguanylate cyclase (GGDEF)-like protein
LGVQAAPGGVDHTRVNRAEHHGAWLLPYLPTPAALVIFWWLNREGLIATRPYWQLVVILLGCGVANLAAIYAARHMDRRTRIQVRAFVAAITTTLIIYTVGWGPMIVIGYAVGIADVIHAEGSEAWGPASFWSFAGVVTGQVLIATDVAPTFLPIGVGNAVALGGFLCAVIVLRMFADASKAAKEAQAELQRQANTDALTGLANRAAITRALDEAVRREQVSVMFVDLDGFKEINDRLGHERGDAVLIEAADRIATSLGRLGTVGRLGGDEFLVLLPAMPERDLVTVADRILEHLREPWPEGGCITASIGIATAVGSESAGQLLDRADSAMYDAKSCGRARWRTAV